MSTRLSRAARENKRLRAQPKTRCDGAAQVFAAFRNYFELRRRAEIHHDARSAVALDGGDAVCEPIGAKFRRIVDQHRHAGLDARLDEERFQVKVRLANLPQR